MYLKCFQNGNYHDAICSSAQQPLAFRHLLLIGHEIGHLDPVNENPALFIALIDEMGEIAFLPLSEAVGSVLDEGLDELFVQRQIRQSHLWK